MTAQWPRNKVRASRRDCRYTGALIAIPKEKLRNSRDGAQSRNKAVSRLWIRHLSGPPNGEVPYDTRGLRLRSRFKTGDSFPAGIPKGPTRTIRTKSSHRLMALPENRVGKAVLPDSGSSPKNPQHHLPCRVCSEFTTTFSPRSSQCSVATPQLLSPSGIGSRFPAQAVQLFSFDRNLR